MKKLGKRLLLSHSPFDSRGVSAKRRPPVTCGNRERKAASIPGSLSSSRALPFFLDTLENTRPSPVPAVLSRFDASAWENGRKSFSLSSFGCLFPYHAGKGEKPMCSAPAEG